MLKDDDDINQISDSLENLNLKEGEIWPKCVVVENDALIGRYAGLNIKSKGVFPLPQKIISLLQHPPFEEEMHKRALSAMAVQPLFTPFPIFTPILVTLTTGMVDVSELDELYRKMSELDAQYLLIEDKQSEEAHSVVDAYCKVSQKYYARCAHLSTFTPMYHSKVMTTCDAFHYYVKLLQTMRITNFFKVDGNEASNKKTSYLFSQLDDDYESDIQRAFATAVQEIPQFEKILSIINRYGQMVEGDPILDEIDLKDICVEYTYCAIKILERCIMEVCGLPEEVARKIYLTNQPRVTDADLANELKVRLFVQDAELGIARQLSLGRYWIFYQQDEDKQLELHNPLTTYSKCVLLTAVGRKLLYPSTEESISFIKRTIMTRSGDQLGLFSTQSGTPFTLIRDCASEPLLIF